MDSANNTTSTYAPTGRMSNKPYTTSYNTTSTPTYREPIHDSSGRPCWCSYAHLGYTCPSHGQTLQMKASNNQTQTQYSPMDRFLNEGPSEQSALFNRADTNQPSTHKDCSCSRPEQKRR